MITLKLYDGPYRSKDEVTITSDAYAVDRVSTTVPSVGSTTVVVYPGVSPQCETRFHSLYTPNYRGLVREGWVIQCPYSKSESVVEHRSSGMQDVTYQGTSPRSTATTSHTNMCDPLQFPSVFPQTTLPQLQIAIARAEEEVLTKVFSKAVAPDADLLVDLSQISETMRMFFTTARRCIELAKSPGAFFRWVKTNSVDKHRTARIPGNPHGRLDELAGLWVELRFGWRPLLHTLDNIAEVLRDGLENQTRRITYRSREDLKLEESNTNTQSNTLYGFNFPSTYTTRVTAQVSVRGGILVERNQGLAQRLGFEWDNVPYAAWDLVPWSFIVDRFLNIGHWLRALRPIPAQHFGGAWVVTRSSVVTVQTAVYSPGDQTSGSGSTYRRWTRSGCTNSLEHRQLAVRRSIQRSPPIFPTLKWDWNRLTDLYNTIDGLMLGIVQVSKAVDKSNGNRGKH